MPGKQENKSYSRNKKMFMKNMVSSFCVMTILYCLALFGIVFYLEISDQDRIVYDIFVLHVKEIYLSIFALSTFFSLAYSLSVRIFLRKTIDEFVNATNNVVNGDFTKEIDIRNIPTTSYELLVIAENFNTMIHELSLVDNLSKDFISNVSHELKTPLSIIQSYATILQNPDISEEEKRDYLAKIINSTRQLTSLISNILKLNKIENDQVKTNKVKYNISSQLSQCVLDFEDMWDKKNISIDFDVPDDTMIYSDPELMQIVWNNIISNSIKFTENGGVLGVTLKESKDDVVITIYDSGCGMTEETKKHIFDKFYQGDTSHSGIGNGLGLSLVKRIIDLTDSKIEVNSELGKGTSFITTIPKVSV